MESDNVEFLDGMQALLLHLRAHGIVALFPVNTLGGDWVMPVELSLRNGKRKTHKLRVLEFVPGMMMNDAQITPPLLQ